MKCGAVAKKSAARPVRSVQRKELAEPLVEPRLAAEDDAMQFLSISEVGRQVGLTPSAIRYYEQIGVVASTQRVHGQRCYDQDAVRRLAVVQHARRTGFSLKEIRQLFMGFPSATVACERWQELAQAKQAELSATIERILMMQSLLTRL